MMIEWTGEMEVNEVPVWRDMPYDERMMWIRASVKFWMEML
jgi:hypothetical protein